jgi:hypothetical protein
MGNGITVSVHHAIRCSLSISTSPAPTNLGVGTPSKVRPPRTRSFAHRQFQHLSIQAQRSNTRRINMSDPPANTTTTPPPMPSPFIQAAGPFSTMSSLHLTAGAYMSIGVCIIVLILWISRYSFLASNSWFPALKQRLGCSNTMTKSQQSGRFLFLGNSVSDEENQVSTPTPPPPAMSRDTLPLYKPSSRFSSDVVLALQGLGSTEGGRPPSYRSKLSGELLASAKGNV